MLVARYGHRFWLWSVVILFVIVGILLCPQTTWAACGDENPTVLCVDADANPTGTPDGLSWTNAFTNVQDALDVTHTYSATNYEIWVAEGVYRPDEGTGTIADNETMSFTLRYNNVHLYGGFAATETLRTQRDWDTHVTILSGDIDGNDTNHDGNFIAETWNDVQGSNAYHVLWLDGVTNESVTETTVIDGFTITAGQANGSDPHDDGGGLYCAGNGSGHECSPALNNVIFSGNQANVNGGGMYNHGYSNGASSPTLTHVTFSGNRANGNGGGMYNNGYEGASSPALTHVTFNNNWADYYGGGMHNQSPGGTGNSTLTHVTFSGNQANDRGGGLYNDSSCPTLNYVTFDENRAYHGGGMYNDSYYDPSSPTLTHVTFTGNRASGNGGGMRNYSEGSGASSPMLIHVIFSGNQADQGGGMSNRAEGNGISNPRLTNVVLSDNRANKGGGLYNQGIGNACSPALTNVTLSDNRANDGGGMYNYSGSPTLTNVIIWGNMAGASGKQLFNTYQSTPILNYTLIQRGIYDIYNDMESNVIYGDGILTGDPHFAAPNAGNYHLQAISPAIDAGDNAAILTGAFTITTDLDGRDRFVDMPTLDTGNGGAPLVDMGAYEAHTLHVDAEALGDATGLGWTDAFTNVQDALDVTHTYSATNYQIWVAEGVYYPDVDADGDHTEDDENESFTLSHNNVQLYGGFAATETLRTQRDWEAHLTILSGDLAQDDMDPDGDDVIVRATHIITPNAHHVLWLDGVTHEPITETTVIDGFTITAGHADGGAPDDNGGGLYCIGEGSDQECSPTLSNIAFRGNRAISNGGGMYSEGSLNGVSNPTLINITFSGNRANAGGGMFSFGDSGISSPVLTNVLFSGNQAQDGSGMYNQASSAGISNPALTNVTLGGNQADWRGGGMVNVNSQPALTNVIIWGNTAVSGTQLYNAQAAPVLSYTLIQSGTNGIYNDNDSNVIYGDGILTSDPYFVAPITATVAPTTAGNYRLQAASPAIDAGDNDAIPVSTDLDGNDRFVDMFAPDSGNGTAPLVDLGPYEAAPPLTLRKTVTPTQNVVHHGTVTYTLILSNSSVVSGYPLLLTDTLPISTTFAAWVVSPPGTLRTGNALTWTGTLTAGHTLTWTFTATHIGNYGESVRNTAYVSSTVQRGEAHATFTVERPVLFVDVDAPGSIHDGLSWTTAYTNVQDALDFTNAYSARVYEIWVAEGVYYPDVDGDGDHTDDDENESFTLSYNNVQLYGGFAGTETLRTQRNSEAHLTVLSGDLAQDDTDPNGDGVTVRATHIITPNAHHVLWLDGISHEPITETTVIDGFIITAGDANGSDPNNSGGGLYCAGYGSSSECSPALAHVTFSGNQAIYNRGTHPIGNGGGMFSDGGDGGTSNPTLIHVEFNGNRAVRGGGMNNHGSDDGTSSPTLTHVSFTKNHATYYGGGMYNWGYRGASRPTLINVIFSGNQADRDGGGLYDFGHEGGTSSPVLTNVLFSGNRAETGAGMGNNSYDGFSNPVLVNVTFSGNQATHYGGAIYNRHSHPTLTNAILWGNTAGISGTQLHNIHATPVLSYTLIQSGTLDIYNDADSAVLYGDGILTSDPHFVAPISAAEAPTTAGNYRLQRHSTAINAGDDRAVAVATDLDGNPRRQGRVDLGAYEASASLSLVKTVTPTTGVAYHDNVTYTIILKNSGALSDTNVLLTDTLPIGTTFTKWIVSPPGTLRTGHTITWTGMLTAGHTLTWTFSALNIGSSGDIVTNAVYVSSTTQSGVAKATFARVPTYTLTVNTVGEGSVAKSPDRTDYEEGREVILTADAAEGWQFDHWSGGASGTLTETTVIMNAQRVVTATFTELAVCTPITDVELTLQTTGDVYTDTTVKLGADIAPNNAHTPYTYTVDYGSGSSDPATSSEDPLTLSYAWIRIGTYTVEIAIWNCGLSTPQTDTTQVIVTERGPSIYLPLIIRNADQ